MRTSEDWLWYRHFSCTVHDVQDYSSLIFGTHCSKQWIKLRNLSSVMDVGWSEFTT